MDATIFKKFSLTSEEEENILVSFTPEQRAVMQNMRTEAVSCMLVIDPGKNDEHRASWLKFQGQITVLNKLLGEN